MVTINSDWGLGRRDNKGLAASQDMKRLVEYIAKALVENPDEVHVNQIDGEQSVILELKVAPEDRGKVIGKQGRIAQATRVLLKAAATKEGKRAVLEII